MKTRITFRVALATLSALTIVGVATVTVPSVVKAQTGYHSSSQITAAPYVAGIWMRVGDRLTFRLKQNGSEISAEFGSSPVHHVLSGSWNAVQGWFDYTVVRTNASGVTEMYGHLHVLGKNRIRTVIVGTDGQSDLPANFYEDSYMVRR